ncbi:MAG: Fic family protein [Candidatus Eisenbacteria sp.]|nr:Fic family protein [Candidatus Eisenbacteria bacterium]
MQRDSGTYVVTSTLGEEVRAFIPRPLPPEPPLEIDGEVSTLLVRAERELARLNIANELVPNRDWFIYGFVRKEAVLSSQIEGTQATLEDLLAHEVNRLDEPDRGEVGPVEEICNYLDALQYARSQLADPEGLPLSLRLLREAHRRLLHGTRGANKAPGEFRRSQNWIGGTRPGNAIHVPPPPEEMLGCLDAFERYLHQGNEIHPLVRAGFLHVQFETIHPFLDGNGRLGRLLIALLLEHWALLDAPLLYISLYFKQHRTSYYENLNAVRIDGDWEQWTRFFLEGIASVAVQATDAARELNTLFETDRKRVLALARTSVGALRLVELLPDHPIVSVARVMALLETTRPTATKAVDLLVDHDILEERSGRRRDRAFAYRHYLELLGQGTGLEE